MHVKYIYYILFIVKHYRPYFAKFHSILSRGQTGRVFSQCEMQWKWKAWLQVPQATVHSVSLFADWLAWHSMQGSIIWLRQMAQLSTTMSHDQRATPLHFFTSKRLPLLTGANSIDSSLSLPSIAAAYPQIRFINLQDDLLALGGRGGRDLLAAVAKRKKKQIIFRYSMSAVRGSKQIKWKVADSYRYASGVCLY